jgi:hypothetical protein
MLTFIASPNQQIMKNSILLAPLFIVSGALAQTNQLRITHVQTGQTRMIREGDKVLFSVRMARHLTGKKPSDVYVLSAAEVKDSVFITTKGRVLFIGDSTIILKERNSLFSSTRRELRINKINTIKRLSTGNQVLRTVATTGAGLTAGIMTFYSYAAVGGGEGFISGMFEAAGGTAVLSRFGKTRIPKKQMNKWTIGVEKLSDVSKR